MILEDTFSRGPKRDSPASEPETARAELSPESALKVGHRINNFLHAVQGTAGDPQLVLLEITNATEGLSFDEMGEFGNRVQALRKPDGSWDAPPPETPTPVQPEPEVREKKRGRRSTRGAERKVARREASPAVPEKSGGREEASSRAREIISRVTSLASFRKALSEGVPLLSEADLAALEKRNAELRGKVREAPRATKEEQLEFDLRPPTPPKHPDQYEMDLGESPELAPPLTLAPKEIPRPIENPEDLFPPDTATPEIYETFPDTIKPIRESSRFENLKEALQARSVELRARTARLYEGGKRAVEKGAERYREMPRWKRMVVMGTLGAGIGAMAGPAAAIALRMVVGASGGAVQAAAYEPLFKAKKVRMEKGEPLAWYHPLRNPAVTAGIIGAFGALAVSQSMPQILDALKGPAEDAWRWLRDYVSPQTPGLEAVPVPEAPPPITETLPSTTEIPQAPTSGTLPIIKGSSSVWSILTGSLADQNSAIGSVLAENGVQLSDRGRQAFAHAFQRAMESGNFQNILFHNDAVNPANWTRMAWNNIPDGTTVDLQAVFNNPSFRETFSQVLRGEYPSLAHELTGSRRGNVSVLLEKMMRQ